MEKLKIAKELKIQDKADGIQKKQGINKASHFIKLKLGVLFYKITYL